MNITILRRLTAVITITLALGCRSVAYAQSPDTILEWNRILLTTLSTPGATSPTVFFTRGPAADARRHLRRAQLVQSVSIRRTSIG